MAATNPRGGNGSGNRPVFGEGRVHGGEEVPRTPTPPRLERQPPIASLLPFLGLSALVPDRASSSLAVARTTLKRRRHGLHSSRARSVNQQLARLGLEAATSRRAEARALALITAEVGYMSVRSEASAIVDLDVNMDVAAPWPLPPMEDDGATAPPPSPANSDSSM